VILNYVDYDGGGSFSLTGGASGQGGGHSTDWYCALDGYSGADGSGGATGSGGSVSRNNVNFQQLLPLLAYSALSSGGLRAQSVGGTRVSAASVRPVAVPSASPTSLPAGTKIVSVAPGVQGAFTVSMPVAERRFAP
jgi:hypothetical protein